MSTKRLLIVLGLFSAVFAIILATSVDACTGGCTVISDYCHSDVIKHPGTCTQSGSTVYYRGDSGTCGYHVEHHHTEDCFGCPPNTCGGGGGCVGTGICQTTCTEECGGGTCKDNCGADISCNTGSCFSSDTDLKFNGSDGPVNLEGGTSGTLSWSTGYNGPTPPTCVASCQYVNLGEATSCGEFSGSVPPSGTQVVTPRATARYAVTCTKRSTVSDSVVVKVRRYRCLFGLCQGSWQGTIGKFIFPSRNSCISGCRSFLPER